MLTSKTRAGGSKRRTLTFESLEDRRLLSVTPSTAFSLHSNEEAAHVIYLDFDGHTTTNTSWNTSTGLSEIETPAYTLDSDSAFSEQELESIYEIWAYTSEYFAPFNVDVTTDAASYTNDNGIRVAIGGKCTDWYTTSNSVTGVSYVGAFTYTTDVPAFVFSANCSSSHSAADTIAHEVGHSLGLSHDSTAEQEYYPGANGWSPIMGGGSGPVQQWSKGEYSGATNLEDDLEIIVSRNGFGYRADDYGNTMNTAAALSANSFNEFYAEGIIEQNTDSDYFKVVLTNTSDLYIKMSPGVYNCSLDTQLKLYDATGRLISSDAPTTSLSAEILARNLAAGTYYIQAANDGCGSFYSNYGSLGGYVLSGTIGSSAKTTVTTLSDTVNANDGVLSLREALANASAGDRIVFSEDVFKTGDVIQLASELTIPTGVTIDASNLYDSASNTPGLTLKAAEGCRHFTISGGTVSAPVTLQGLALIDGYVSGNGGSILLSGTLNIKQCEFQNNLAYSSSVNARGGVIYSDAASTQVNIYNSRFIGNYADYGGVVALQGKLSVVNFDSSFAAGNRAYIGAVFYSNWTCAQTNILNSVLAGNNNRNPYGTICSSGTCSVQSSTIAGNTGGSAIYLSNSNKTHTIENSIIAGNYDNSNPSDIYINGTANINYSLIGNAQTLTLGTGCISGTKANPMDPGFTSFTPNTGTWSSDDWKAWDFTLNQASCAINAGSNAKAISAFNAKLSEETDVTGKNSRLTGSTIDMGAYEQTNLTGTFSGMTFSTDSPMLNEALLAIPSPPYIDAVYQWYRSSDKNGEFTEIENASARSFTPDESCLGQYLKCVGVDADGNTYSCVTDDVVRISEKSSLIGQTEIQVTSTLDITDQCDGIITLREAIAYANELNVDKIVFSDSIANSKITLTQGELEIITPITIDGGELGIIVTTVSGRLFNVSGGTDSAPVTLIGLHLTGGNTTENGGAILAAGTIKIQSCNIYDNYSGRNGGVIASNAAQAHIYFIDSTITGNEAASGGVCYLAESMNKLYIISSLVAGNSAQYCGVFYSGWSCSVITILNSAVTGNKAYNYGVGYNYGQILVYNSTIAGNADYYSTGGINFGSGRSTHKIENSIIALNTSANSSTNDFYADNTVTINNSLIGNGSVNNVVQGSGNLIGSASSPRNPDFVSLSSVSAQNWTKDTWKNWDYSLKSTSAAVNAGSNSLALTAFGLTSTAELAAENDVQGKTRLYNGTIDMGACEYNTMTPLTKPTLNTPTANGSTVSVSWGSVPNASGYELEYKPASSSTWTNISVNGTSALFTGTANQTYNIRVKAIGTGSYSDSEWSSTTSVTTEKIELTAPPLTASAAGSDSVSVTIGNVNGASSYTLEYAANASFTNAMTQTLASAGTQTISGLDANTTYFFRVKAIGTGSYSDSEWSSAASVTTEKIELTAPTITASAAGSDSVSVTIGNINGASSYTLEYAANASFTNAVSLTFTSEGTRKIMELSPNTTYFFRVKAIGTGSYSDSDWSSTASVTTEKIQLTAPALTASANGSDSVSVTIGNVNGASSYTLEYAANTDFTNAESLTFASAGTKKIMELSPNTEYFFRVKANGSVSYSDSDWSQTQTKTHPSYVEAEITQLRAFLEQTDSDGVKNGTKLNSAYDADDVSTWTGITWTENENGEAAAAKIFWKDADLVGILNLKEFTCLTHFESAGSPEMELSSVPESMAYCNSQNVQVGSAVELESAITLNPASENEQEISESVTLLNEWSTFHVELWAEFGLEKTFEVSWDSNVFTLDLESTVLRDGVTLEVKDAGQTAVTDANGITTVSLTLSMKNGFTANAENAMCAALSFKPVSTAGNLKAGESLTSAVTVDGKRFETAVHSVIYDMDDDGSIDVFDLIQFARLFGTNSESSWQANFNSDSNVDVWDLILFARNFGLNTEKAKSVTYDSTYVPNVTRDVQPVLPSEEIEIQESSPAAVTLINPTDLAMDEFWAEQEEEKERKRAEILQKMR